MVGVLVGVQDGVNQWDSFPQQLGTQIGRGVDEQIALGQLEHDRAARPVVSRVVALANGAIAPDRWHANAGAGTEENHGRFDFALGRSTQLWHAMSRFLLVCGGGCRGNAPWLAEGDSAILLPSRTGPNTQNPTANDGVAIG